MESYLNRIKAVFIFVIPLFYLTLGFYFRQIFGDLSLRSNDPEYIHFLSGMCVATGQFDQTNVDQPASALHVLLALVFRLVYFFRESSRPFFEDALLNSDLYLAVGNLVITTLLSVALLYAGFRTFKITGNVFYAVLLQFGPFLINIWYEIIGRIYAELLFLIPVMIIQVQILKKFYREREDDHIEDVLAYAAAVAVGMAIKMTFLPLVIIPLILLRTAKKKLQCAAISLAAFLVLALPVTLQAKYFLKWMIGLFLHSGRYQSGGLTIINLDSFINNIKIFIGQEKYFVILILLAIISALFIVIINKKLKQPRLKNLLHINAAILTAISLSLFIVFKQYEPRYVIPALLFFPFLLVLLQENILCVVNKKIFRLFLNIATIILMVVLFNQHMAYARIVSDAIGSDMQARQKTREFIHSLPQESCTIIVSQDYGCPYQEYAIMYGFCMAGRNWPGHRETLDKLYPDRYFYFTWDDTIKRWGSDFDPRLIAGSGKPVFLYLEKDDEELYERTERKLLERYPGVRIRKENLFHNGGNGEGILQLQFICDKGC
jgi:hypothetical protein